MLKYFRYKKANGSVSDRVVHPMGIAEDKLFAVDLTEFNADEREDYEAILNQIHSQYVQAIKDVGLGNSFRYFFFEGIENVQTE